MTRVGTTPRDRLRDLLSAAIVITALYVGAVIFVPIALAVLLSFALAPGVRMLQKWHLGRILPALLMTGLAFLVILGLGGLLVSQLRSLADDLPRHEPTVLAKIESLRGLVSGGGMSRFADFTSNLTLRLRDAQKGAARSSVATGEEPAKPAAPQPAADLAGRPVPVVVERPEELPIEMLARYLAPVIHPAVVAGLVAIYVVFMLVQREDLRNRAIRLFGVGDLHRSTAAIDDAARRLSRYLVSQIAVNAAAGVVIGLGLALIGVPSPILFGMMFALMRFIPYVGPPLAAAVPLALAAAVFPGWTPALWTAGLYVLVEAVVGQAVEPLLYGHNTGLSPVAVVAGATFWTALWGPVGLALATPMTVCLVVLGRHVEPLAFLDVMFGDRPPLAPSEAFYQRMLAEDPVEASDQAERLLAEMSLTAYYDEILLPGLLMAQDDVDQGRLDLDRQRRIGTAVADVIENVSDHVGDGRTPAGIRGDAGAEDGGAGRDPASGDATPQGSRSAPAQGPAPRRALPRTWTRPGAVLCIGGRGPLDDAVASALAQAMVAHGFGAVAVPHDMLTRARIAGLAIDGVQLACLSCLDSNGVSYLRFAHRRLQQRGLRVPILVGAWWRRDGREAGADPEPKGQRSVSTLAESITFAEALAAGRDPDEAAPAEPRTKDAGGARDPA